MRNYQPNRACGCARCRTRGLMGPAILITLGILFLLQDVSGSHGLLDSGYPIWRTWPVLLIVIGAIKVVCYVTPDSGHQNPGQVPPFSGQYPGATFSQTQTPAQAPVVTPPPRPGAGALGEGKSSGDDEVPNG